MLRPGFRFCIIAFAILLSLSLRAHTRDSLSRLIGKHYHLGFGYTNLYDPLYHYGGTLAFDYGFDWTLGITSKYSMDIGWNRDKFCWYGDLKTWYSYYHEWRSQNVYFRKAYDLHVMNWIQPVRFIPMKFGAGISCDVVYLNSFVNDPRAARLMFTIAGWGLDGIQFQPSLIAGLQVSPNTYAPVTAEVDGHFGLCTTNDVFDNRFNRADLHTHAYSVTLRLNFNINLEKQRNRRDKRRNRQIQRGQQRIEKMSRPDSTARCAIFGELFGEGKHASLNYEFNFTRNSKAPNVFSVRTMMCFDGQEGIGFGLMFHHTRNLGKFKPELGCGISLYEYDIRYLFSAGVRYDFNDIVFARLTYTPSVSTVFGTKFMPVWFGCSIGRRLQFK